MNDYSSGESFSEDEDAHLGSGEFYDAAEAGVPEDFGRISSSSRITKWDVARGMDPQGIPWHSLVQTRGEYRCCTSRPARTAPRG